MKFLSFTSALSIALFSITANAKTLDVWSPKIISPNSTTVWQAGALEVVTWETQDAPVNISNGASVVLHEYQTATVLAAGFDLRAGVVNVTVPQNATGIAYIVLFGDSGNWGQPFTIAP